VSFPRRVLSFPFALGGLCRLEEVREAPPGVALLAARFPVAHTILLKSISTQKTRRNMGIIMMAVSLLCFFIEWPAWGGMRKRALSCCSSLFSAHCEAATRSHVPFSNQNHSSTWPSPRRHRTGLLPRRVHGGRAGARSPHSRDELCARGQCSRRIVSVLVDRRFLTFFFHFLA